MSSLTLISTNRRIEFLKLFTKELLNNSIEKEEQIKKVNIQKLKQKFIEPLEPEKNFQQINTSQVFQPKENIMVQNVPQRIVQPVRRELPSQIQQVNRPRPVNPIRNAPPQLIKPNILPLQLAPQNISPEPNQTPAGFNLGKLESLLKDPGIQSIECPGPGKNIVVKKFNRPQVTNMNMSQLEISEIIEKFSTSARIPIVGGILKAAVGNLIISAIISEFVGSRFIVNRITQRPNN